MKRNIKKAIVLLLSALMAFSVPFSLSAGAADGGVTYLKREWDPVTNTITETEETLQEPTKSFPGEISGGGWFVIGSDQTVENRVTVPAGVTVNLLLTNNATLTCKKGIGVAYGATLNIYGQASDAGKLVATGGKYDAGVAGNDETGHGAVNIYGGTVEATGGDYAAGIGTGDQTDGACQLIAIYGGIVTATGGVKAAGIGGGNESRGGSIRICGGEISANGGDNAAGIGAGDECGPSHIYIYGGNIRAVGGTYGAGVGEGMSADEDSNTGEIFVYDCEKLVAIGGLLAAGVGGGFDSNTRSKIYIEGGVVSAYGGGNNNDAQDGGGAGSGAGSFTGIRYVNMHGGDFNGIIDIKGGKVTAYSGGSQKYGGAAIGSGHGGNMTGIITVSGGQVTAVGRYGGAAIGAGAEAFSGDGGECEGPIRILDGTLQLTADPTNWDETDRPSIIGHGYDGDEQGTLELGDYLSVSLGITDPVLTEQREATCRKGTSVLLNVAPCEHGNVDYTAVGETTHDIACKTCKYTGRQSHLFRDGHCGCGAEGYYVFYYDGESLIDFDVIYGGGKTAVRPENPERDDLLFENWYRKDDAAYTAPYDFSQPVTEDLHLVAHWQALVSVMAYDLSEDEPLQGGKVRIEGTDADYDYNAILPAEPGSFISVSAIADEGYEFLGWEFDGREDLIESPSFGFNAAKSSYVVAVFQKHVHSYGRPAWSWTDDHTAALTLTCLDCGHEITLNAAVTETELSPADCENDRVVRYTAAVAFDGDTYTDSSAEIALPGTATGHSFGAPAWSWADGYTAAAATFTCGTCGHTVVLTDASPATTEVSPATATADQVVKHTATVTLDGTAYTDEYARHARSLRRGRQPLQVGQQGPRDLLLGTPREVLPHRRLFLRAPFRPALT